MVITKIYGESKKVVRRNDDLLPACFFGCYNKLLCQYKNAY